MEAKDYIQTLSYKSTQKNPKTQTKILQDPLNKTSYINQEALTFDFENIGNICEDIVAKEIPRNTCN